ncbi:MAG: DUF1698 domain-containing protein [Blastocatellales bacterium]|nr:DUF1698 domain-containing protein [Blastocatellales bacterium]
MPDSSNLRDLVNRIGREQHERILSGSWWHSIDLGGGLVTEGVHALDELKDNYERFGLPADLTGRSVIDIGCWDGFYSFESARRGARVVAVDCWRPENFFTAREALNLDIPFHELSVYESTRDRLGAFDITLFLGVLYHLRHPLLALERVCEVTREVAIIETHASDNLFETEHPVMEFYEIDELGGQYDNWWGPNTSCLVKMVRAAGFARAEVIRRQASRAVVRAHRKWERREMETAPSLEIRRAVNAVTMEEEIPRRGRRAFIDLSVAGLPLQARRETVEVEVGGFGIGAIYFGQSPDPQRAGTTQINAPVPPGLDPGITDVVVRFGEKRSNEFPVRIVDAGEW